MPFRFRGIEVQRHVGDDGRQFVAHLLHVRALAQLVPHAVAHVQRAEVGVDLLHAVIPPDQIQRGFFADARHAGDVVAGVAHQRLEVDHADGVEAVLLPEALHRVVDGLGLAHAGLDVQYPRFVRDELEGVLVPGGDDALVPRFLAEAGDAAQQVVGLEALALHAEDAHGVQHILEDGHLHCQLLRHALALGLVALVLLMPEGRCF